MASFEPPLRTGTPHSTESASGEPSSELASSLLQQAQQQRDQLAALQHHQHQQPGLGGGISEAQAQAMAAQLSKSEHEAIFGRAASTPAASAGGASPGSSSVRSPIVAHEQDEDDAFRHSHHQQPPQPPPSTAPAPSAGHGGHSSAPPPNHNMIATGRSPRLAPAQALAHAPELQIGSHAAPPTALMIMRRRRSNSHGDSTHGRRDDLGGSHGSRGSLGGSRHRSGSLGGSGGRHRSPGAAPKASPKIDEAPPDLDPNEALHCAANLRQQSQPQQARVYNAQAAMAMNPHHPHMTAVRYNSSLHSTLGGYPMGAPTQLTHPSVTLELIARDRARWEADYYTGGAGGYGMDYGMDYGYDYYGSGLRGMGGGTHRHAELERLQGLYQPRTSGHTATPQERQQQALREQMHQRQIKQAAFPQPAHGPKQPQPKSGGGEGREAASSTPEALQEANNSTPNARRVYHERDYNTDRVWREDDHTRTAAVPPERRHTDKTSNTDGSKNGRENEKIEIHEGAALPSFPQLQPSQIRGVPGVPGQGPMSGSPYPQAGVPQKGVPQPQLAQQHTLPRGSHRLSDYEADTLSYHSAMAAHPAHPYYQAPPPTPVQTPERPVDPIVRQISDLSALSGQALPMHPNGAVPYPHYAQGLLYPPTPGSVGGLPPQLAALYQQQQQQQHLDPRGWVDPYPRAQAAAPAAGEKAQLQTTHEDRVHAPAPSVRDLDASAPPRLEGNRYPAPLAKGGKRVSFSTLEIRTYETVLGDNPSCSAGPPLGLGWRYDPSHVSATVDEYEAHLARLYGTDPDGAPRTVPPEDLVLHRFEREAILLNTGYTRQDLADGVRAANKVKNKRRQTVHNLPVAFVEERAEGVRRTLRRWVLKKPGSKVLYEEWKRGGAEGGGRRGSV